MGDFELIAGKRVLFVMATDAEYGPHLRKLFRPLMTGVGPIEAALAMGQACASMKQSGGLPDVVVALGSAGSRRCTLGEVYQVSTVSWRDMDATRIGFPKGVTPLLGQPAEISLSTPLRLETARLSTGANIVGGEAFAAIDADMVDMETYAVARACQGFGLSLVGLRGISDGPGEIDGITGWTDLLPLLDQRLADAVNLLPEALMQVEDALHQPVVRTSF